MYQYKVEFTHNEGTQIFKALNYHLLCRKLLKYDKHIKKISLQLKNRKWIKCQKIGL